MKKQSSGFAAGMERELSILAQIVLVLAVLWLIWTLSRQVIVLPAYGLYWFALKAADTLQLLNSKERELLDYFESMLGASDGRLANVNWDGFMAARDMAGWKFRFVAAFGMGTCSFAVYRFDSNNRFNRKFSISGERYGTQSLFRYQVRVWKSALGSFLFESDGINKDIKTALTAAEWIAAKNIGYECGHLNFEMAEEALKEQLGPKWLGLKNSDPNVQTLMVLFAMHMTEHPDSVRARTSVSKAWSAGRNGRKASDLVVEKYCGEGKIKETIELTTKNHAYERTALCSVLEMAKQYGGVLPCPEFLWLRSLDRTLWYSIHNVGRKAFFVEGLAVAAHFMMEKNMNMPVSEVNFDTTIQGLELYLKKAEISSPF